MFRRGITTEIRWFFIYFSILLVLGLLSGAAPFVLISGLLAYIAWIFFQLHRLESWVMAARRRSAPANNFRGIWSEIADDIVLLGNRYKKDKQRLQAVVSRVQDMTSALGDGVVLLDNRSNVEWWNTAAQQLFDFQKVDLGHKLTNIIRHPRFVRYFENEDYEEPIELESLRRTGEHLQFQIHPFGAGEKLLVIRDVTRLYKLEVMRQDFVANVSHELRTPLTVIRGYVETLGDSKDTPPAWKRALTQMQQQCHRMTMLVNDLITLTKLETDDMEVELEGIKILPLVESILSDARALSGEKQQIISHSVVNDFRLLGNERELRSAISNLVFNAVKYSPSNCSITVSAKLNLSEMIITISDDGVGIDPKHIPRLTERFYRVDGGRATSTGGTGLGLAIVKHVLFRHDAELKISSTIGKGSHFSCHFPIGRMVN